MVTIDTNSGPFVFETRKRTKLDVMRMFSAEIASLNAERTPSSAMQQIENQRVDLRPDHPVEIRLNELETLRRQGVLSEDEYRGHRKRILEDL